MDEVYQGPPAQRSDIPRTLSWTLLGGLLTILVIAAAIYERSDWTGTAPGEATYLMQAESLAWDFDLTYERRDFDRFTASFLAQPRDLALASDSGRRIAFDAPFPYALYLAPFMRLKPQTGFALANALLLVGIALAAARTLEVRTELGKLAPAAVALLIFGSATFAYVFLATAEVFLLSATVAAFLLLTGPGGRRRSLVAGGLLAVVVASHPLYAALLPAALWLAKGRDRLPLALSGTAALLALAVVHWWHGGGLLWLGSVHFRFSPHTGYPLVDFAADTWQENLRQLKAFHWDGAPKVAWGLEARLWAWNLCYLALGRTIGVLPYFLPVLWLLFVSVAGITRRALLLACALWGLALLAFWPFNLAGSPPLIGNRLFLPLYGALWLLPRRRRSWIWLAVVSAAAAPFLLHLWADYGTPPVSSAGQAVYQTDSARRFLPYETSQRRLAGPPGDLEGVRFYSLTPSVWVETRRGWLRAEGDVWGELLMSSPVPLDVLRLELEADAPSRIDLRGGEQGAMMLRSDGGVTQQILLSRSPRRHATWWTPQPQYFYHLGFRLPGAGKGPFGFRPVGEQLPDASGE